MILFREHFAVPEGLQIRLVDNRAWKYELEGVFFHTLWRDPQGAFYMCDHVVACPNDPPFWDTTRMSDLIECDPAHYFMRSEVAYRQESK